MRPRIWPGGPMRGLGRSPWGWENPWGVGGEKRLQTDIRGTSPSILRPCRGRRTVRTCKFHRMSAIPPPYPLRPLRRDLSSVAIQRPARDREGPAENWGVLRFNRGGSAPHSLSDTYWVTGWSHRDFKIVTARPCSWDFRVRSHVDPNQSNSAQPRRLAWRVCFSSRLKRDGANGSANGVVVYL